jgi:phosphatidylserine decarboxylase precursor-related protein
LSPESFSRSQPAVASSHPEELVRLDAPYLVPWGRREIRRASAICAPLLAASLLLAGLLSAWWLAAAAAVAILWAFLVLFFRNPRRVAPGAPGLLVAPADGIVCDLEELDEPRFIRAPALRIGIFLSVLDVHVNRAPCGARVDWLEHREGAYHDARSPRAALENESTAIGLTRLEEGGPGELRLLLRQVSGAIARRIVCPLVPGMHLERGGLIGMIKFGSRTEVWVPLESGFEVAVRKGERVQGGVTVLGSFAAGPEARGYASRGPAWDILTKADPQSAPAAPGAYRAPRRGRTPPGGRCGGGLPPPRGV